MYVIVQLNVVDPSYFKYFIAYIYNKRTLSENIKFICTIFRNRF
jgi:hypothetical protein